MPGDTMSDDVTIPLPAGFASRKEWARFRIARERGDMQEGGRADKVRHAVQLGTAMTAQVIEA